MLQSGACIIATSPDAEVAALLRPLAQRERAITVTVETPPGLPQAIADSDRLRQILANLVRRRGRPSVSDPCVNSMGVRSRLTRSAPDHSGRRVKSHAVSVATKRLHKDDRGGVFHTYSCYARGLDMLNGAYHWLDLVPKGRDETGPHKMTWVRLHDEYAR